MPPPPGSYSQVAYVVHDLEAAVEGWVRTLGAGPFFVFDNVVEDKIYRGRPAHDTNRAAMGFLGALNIEIFQPSNTEPSMYREILDTRGETVHHTLPAMRPLTPEQFDAKCSGYAAAGLVLATSGVVPGAGRIAFYDALKEIGQFIEVIELSPAQYPVMDVMYEAHVGWDGRDPIRSLDSAFAAVFA